MALTAHQHKLLKTGVVAFKVLAWVALGLQSLLGLAVVVIGGDPVFIGTVEMPARFVGLINCLGAPIYFFMFMIVSAGLQLLLDLHEAAIRPR
jgi:hypothetical protein